MVTVLSVEPYKGKTVRITLSEGEPVLLTPALRRNTGCSRERSFPMKEFPRR